MPDQPPIIAEITHEWIATAFYLDRSWYAAVIVRVEIGDDLIGVRNLPLGNGHESYAVALGVALNAIAEKGIDDGL